MFVSLQKVTDDGVIDNAINFDHVRCVTYDNLSDTPSMYIVYNSGVVERFPIASRAVYDDLVQTLFIMEE